jgi:hypothetical protein
MSFIHCLQGGLHGLRVELTCFSPAFEFGRGLLYHFLFHGIQLVKQPPVPQVEAAPRLFVGGIPLLAAVKAPASRSTGDGPVQVI